MKHKRCSKCGVRKRVDKFGRRGPRRQWCQSWCETCRAARRRHCYATDPVYRAKQNAASLRQQKAKMRSGDIRYIAQHLVWHTRSRAKRKGIPFEIEIDDILPALKAGVCPVFGVPFARLGDTNGVADGKVPSLDQLRPGIGYTRANTRVVSWRANAVKRDSTAEELAAVLKWMKRELH